MTLKKLKIRLAAFGLAMVMGLLSVGNAAQVSAAEGAVGQKETAMQENPVQESVPVQRRVVAKNLTKSVKDRSFLVGTCLEGIQFDPEKDDVSFNKIIGDDGSEYQSGKAGIYTATYLVTPKDQSECYVVTRKITVTDYPKIKSCSEISREILEEYLIFLQTEDTGVNNFRSDLTRLRAVLETIGKIYGYRHLEQLFLNTDIPYSARTELKSYSDKELKRFNAVFVKMEEQMCRLMVIHQMLGTRISDTLTLQTDCLYEQEGRPMIRIQQMKTNTFVKPISAELELLIQKAIQYTRRKYGEIKFIFVNEKNPERPMQYNTVQNRVMAMIQKEDLRDDKGQLFGFGTHMFRHCYGIRLTEMHYDDWTIAKLLGHRSIKNVKYYRRMSLQIVADETREVRERKSRLIEKYLDGWGEEYEQVRQHD